MWRLQERDVGNLDDLSNALQFKQLQLQAVALAARQLYHVLLESNLVLSWSVQPAGKSRTLDTHGVAGILCQAGAQGAAPSPGLGAAVAVDVQLDLVLVVGLQGLEVGGHGVTPQSMCIDGSVLECKLQRLGERRERASRLTNDDDDEHHCAPALCPFQLPLQLRGAHAKKVCAARAGCHIFPAMRTRKCQVLRRPDRQ